MKGLKIRQGLGVEIQGGKGGWGVYTELGSGGEENSEAAGAIIQRNKTGEKKVVRVVSGKG